MSNFWCFRLKTILMLEIRATVRQEALTWLLLHVLLHFSTLMTSMRDGKRMGKWKDKDQFWEGLKRPWRKVLYISPLGWKLCFDTLWSGSFSPYICWGMEMSERKKMKRLPPQLGALPLKPSPFHCKDWHTVLLFALCKSVMKCRSLQPKAPEMS